MDAKELLYTGKSKQVWSTDDPGLVILRFTDAATAFNAKKKATIADKGRMNRQISTHLFREVGRRGVRHHVVRELGPDELLCEKVDIVPIEVVVRNRAAGGLCKRYGIPEGTALREPLVELFYKSDALDDPLIGADTAVALGFAKRWELAYLHESALEVNDVLSAFWDSLGIELVDAKYEYGRRDGRLVLADELTPDGARLWDRATGQRLDKDVFRRDLGDLGDTYRQLLERITHRTAAG